jgi:4-diphosphocytidyl-2C-methyl-D-erythritol kinase
MAEDNVTLLLSITEMINSNLEAIEKLEAQLKKHAEMLEDIFTNDATYQEHAKLAKEAVQVKAKTKQQILKTPQAGDLYAKVRDFKNQIKETKTSMSEYLQEYARLSGSTDFEDGQGNLRKIIYVAKLVKF